MKFEEIENVEKDPTGREPHTPGAKLDEGKIFAGLLLDFSLALTEVAKVCTFGAKKYSRGGWLTVPNWEDRYKDAEFRHMLLTKYEEYASDSKLSHEAHRIWNALAHFELTLRKKKGIKNVE